MKSPIKLVSLSDAGGVGKTTIAVNLAYEWSLRGYSVVIIDLDSNHSLDSFVDLEPELDPNQTSAKIFDVLFDGIYPCKNIFGSKLISVIQGTQELKEVTERLVSRKLREYTLAKALKKYPLDTDLIIFDCRSGFDLMSENALSASTHVLIPLDMGVKALTAANLIQYIWSQCSELELEPNPEILGLIPNHFNNKSADELELLSALKDVAAQLEIPLYSPLRKWQRLKNAALRGQPMKQLRSSDPVNLNFAQLADVLEKIKLKNYV